MWISWLAQVALLTALHLLATVDVYSAEEKTKKNETCQPYNFTQVCLSKRQQLKGRQISQKAQGLKTGVRRVCYVTLPYYPKPDNNTAHLCTHIIAGFVKTLPNGTMRMVRKSDPQQYQDLLDLRSCNTDLKVLVTTGINNYNNRTDSTNFSVLVNTKKGREKFVNASLTFLRQYGFDGLDLDWEYPGHYKNYNSTHNASVDKANFALLLQELQASFKNRNDPEYCGDLLLSVPVSATKPYIDDGYDIKNISEHADLINLMCYNYHLHHAHKNYTRHNSPLFRNEDELKSPILKPEAKVFFSRAYIEWTVDYLKNLSINESKLNIGIPAFGRTFALANETLHGFLAPATGPGPGSGNGFVEYHWVCNFTNQEGTKTVYNETIVASYAYKDKVWVAYNEKKAITAKVNWTVRNNFGGVMTYALNMDDVNGTCGNGSYPIHTWIRDFLLNLTKQSTDR